jgi:hypothetical protein
MTGSMSQFPARKQVSQRTITNRSQGDRAVKMADPEAAMSRWTLSYSGLTDTEIEKLHELFVACEGRLQDFIWIDPFGNMLRWTEDFSKPVWQSSLQTAAEIDDPEGGARAWRVTNAAQAGQALTQSVDAPGWFQYSFSLWARSSSTDTVDLKLFNSDGFIATKRAVSSDWERITVSGQIAGTAEEIRCALEVPAACAVDVYGPQLDAQRDASGYRKNTNSSGVLTARFDQDEFEYVSHGQNNHATEIRVVTARKVGP